MKSGYVSLKIATATKRVCFFDASLNPAECSERAWFNTEWHMTRTLSFERDNGLVNVVVDAPQDIPNTIPSVWEVTNPELALVRLHGRNHGPWILCSLTALLNSMASLSHFTQPPSAYILTGERAQYSNPEVGLA